MEEYKCVDLISDGKLKIGVYRHDSDNVYWLGVDDGNGVKVYAQFDGAIQSLEFMDCLAEFVNARVENGA